ncbi:hypothetical protein VMCG_06083 [Cytospora schulzeri]|uniref:beta-glucosidase n=1 Tax=Cytospora schulzeri TaxID=448051 RepID=A0A423WGI2_9PEZI|nr:hypothetical protein VMCG_06083 [Valsa malicola]
MSREDRIEALLRALTLEEKCFLVLGAEARSKNSHRRNFENFGEDPYLTGVMAAGYIRGVQEQGVGACMKHYVANDMETWRFNMDHQIDERTLREIYLKPFRALMALPRVYVAPSPVIAEKGRDAPPRSLVGFSKSFVLKGKSELVRISLDVSAVSWFDVEGRGGPSSSGRWRADTGTCKCFLGTSSRDIIADAEVVVE